MSHPPEIRPNVVFLASERIGQGNDALGEILMRSFVKTLPLVVDPPSLTVICVNGAVRLTTRGTDLGDDLKALEAAGAEIFSCGTCLDFFHKKDALVVGQVTNMADTVTRLAQATRVIRP